jgi:phosphomannomutase
MASGADTTTSLALLMDVDGTLTPPREPLPIEMAEALQRLTVPFHVAAGSDLALVEPQLLVPLWKFGFDGKFEAFLSNGAAHYRCDFTVGMKIEKRTEFDLRVFLGEEDFSHLKAVLEQVLDSSAFRLPQELEVIGERIVDRGSMINVAPIGRPAGALTFHPIRNRQGFVQFDRRTGYRRRMLGVLKRELSDLCVRKNLLVMLGGETSFDILVKGKDKTNAVRALLADGVERIFFIGDALFDEGNDAVILKYIAEWEGEGECPLEAIQVTGWRDTLARLRQHGWVV